MKILADLFDKATLVPPERLDYDPVSDDGKQIAVSGTYSYQNANLAQRYADFNQPHPDEPEEEQVSYFLGELERILKEEIGPLEKSFMQDESDPNVVGIEIKNVSVESMLDIKTVKDLENVIVDIELAIFYDVPSVHLESRLAAFAEKLK